MSAKWRRQPGPEARDQAELTVQIRQLRADRVDRCRRRVALMEPGEGTPGRDEPGLERFASVPALTRAERRLEPAHERLARDLRRDQEPHGRLDQDRCREG